ncbi:MAG TPA: LysM domain-containing protein [Solirubrobacteraceae bacterium]|jgi:LysM repeat protein
MVTRSRGRFLAPIAIIVVIAATVLIVQGQLGSKHHARPQRTNNLRQVARHSGAKAETFYVVKSGDSLSTISTKTGVSVPTLESLNPRVNPGSLQAGQRLRLRQ